jgi:aquaporin Z
MAGRVEAHTDGTATRPADGETGPPRAGPADGASSVAEMREVSPALAQAMLGHGPPWVQDFSNLSYEWRRLAAEGVGTFFLVLAGVGGAVVASLHQGGLGTAGLVVAPGLTVMAMILSTGAVSGAHFNPVVTMAFTLRREFPLRRVPLYLLAQLMGALLACLFVWAAFGRVGSMGATVPGPHTTGLAAAAVEAVLTFGLVTTILGTASGAQNVGPLSALAVAGYISLAGLWAAPVSGASMNPVRSLAPELLTGHLGTYWIYLAGPTVGMLAAVGLAFVLRGPGADPAATRAAQGTLGTFLIQRMATASHPDDLVPPAAPSGVAGEGPSGPRAG